MRRRQRDIRSDDGQDLVEYGLLACFVSVAAVAAIQALGNTVLVKLWEVINDGLFH